MTKEMRGEIPASTRGAHGPGGDRRALRLDDAAALELDRRTATVLAFGSQLLHGSVGLNAADRVYSGNGIRAVQVPTILLSVMPHYASVHDVRVSPTWLSDALSDLELAGALSGIEFITAGYFASCGQPAAVADWYEKQPVATRPPLILDPTLGDTELGFYTDPGLVTALKEELVPVATGIVPNLFELALLTGQPLESLDSRAAVEAAARSLMGEQTEWIAVTGVRLSPEDSEGSRSPAVPDGPGEAPSICEILVRRSGSSVHAHRALDTRAKGLGDTFTAALIAALLEKQSIAAAVDTAASEVRARAQALLESADQP